MQKFTFGGVEGWKSRHSWISRDFLFPLACAGTKAEEPWNWGERDDGRRNSGSWSARDLPYWSVSYGFGEQ